MSATLAMVLAWHPGSWAETPTGHATMSGIGAADSVPRRDSLRPLDVDTFRQMIASVRDSVVLVDFWATWCAPCRAELPEWIALQRTLAAQGVRLVTVSVDDSADIGAAVQFLDSIGAPAPRYLKQAVHDEAFINAVDTAWSGALPALFIYDRTGRQRARFVGESTVSAVKAALAPLLATPPSRPATPATTSRSRGS